MSKNCEKNTMRASPTSRTPPCGPRSPACSPSFRHDVGARFIRAGLCGPILWRQGRATRVAGEVTHLRFVWFLMACLGGFEVLGLVGLVIGPVVLTLARELWEQGVRDLALPKGADSTSPAHHGT